MAVNNANEAVIGFTGSRFQTAASVYYVLLPSGSNTPSAATQVRAGSFSDTWDGAWGDYSTTLVDPVDGSSFWTFQEFDTFIGAADWYSTWIQYLKR